MNDTFDNEETTKVMPLSQLAILLGKTEQDLVKEKLAKEAHDEFWSDSCWSD